MMKCRKEARIMKEKKEASAQCSITKKEVAAKLPRRHESEREKRENSQGENEKKITPRPFYNHSKLSKRVRTILMNLHLRHLTDNFVTRHSFIFKKFQKGDQNSKIIF